ncbi:group I intron-associated PD-(D/E)XK endonuclease [uncultured Jatrophihabitans sp.]|uniref:group I intron-associated PD-(D/E)XK endonuclease n=1 Tax=uncultured Jatrophihabitans sp. TaxID=1610747 RepID=UPI0035C95231
MSTRAEHTVEELATAVASSRSWRGVLRALGRPDTSAGTFRAVRRQVDALGIDHSHFTGQRRWSDSQLATAIATADSWREVLVRLDLSDGGGNLSAVRGHAARLSLDLTRLDRRPVPETQTFDAPADPAHLRRAGTMLAAAWFTLHGYAVSWPFEPCRYDLLVECERGATQRIQVKTTTHTRSGSPLVGVSASRRRGRAVYLPDEIDLFFILTGELDAYLIPIDAVLGMPQLSLARYAAFRVAEGGRWLEAPVSAGASP